MEFQRNKNKLVNGDPIAICKVSKTRGYKVKTVTLKEHIFEKYSDIIVEDSYFFCPEEDCDIVYFNNSEHQYFSINDVKTRIFDKLRDKTIPICYCLNISEDKIIEEIVIKKCCSSLQDLKNYTGACTGKLCQITNPSGRCCNLQINKAINKALELLNANQLV